MRIGVSGPRAQLAASVETPWPPAIAAAQPLRGTFRAGVDTLWASVVCIAISSRMISWKFRPLAAG